MVGMDGEDDPEKVRRFVEEYDIESPAVYQPDRGYPVVGAHSGRPSRVKEAPCR
jgi:hypothetical protein